MTKRRITTLTVTAKCSDMCFVCANGPNGETIQAGDGFVPDFMPNHWGESHHGDYIQLEIEVKTGKILNWKTPTDMQILRDLEGM